MSGEIAFRLPFGLQMVSSTILGIFINFYFYSPRWLALAGCNEESLLSLAKLRGLLETDTRVHAEWQGIIIKARVQRALQDEKHLGASGIKAELLAWSDLFRGKPMLRGSMVGAGIFFFQQFSGINAFTSYSQVKCSYCLEEERRAKS